MTAPLWPMFSRCREFPAFEKSRLPSFLCRATGEEKHAHETAVALPGARGCSLRYQRRPTTETICETIWMYGASETRLRHAGVTRAVAIAEKIR